MADNITLNTGSGGDTLAADDVGGAKYQRVKVVWGADGTINETAASSGNAIPIQGEAAENAAATGNPVQVGGRYDSTPRTLGNGDVGALALDADGALHISDGGNTITVDGTVTANAGSGTFTVDLGANNDVVCAGDVANDAADSGNPVKIGAHATNFIEGETQVANSDRVDVKADLNGVLLTRNATTLEELVSFHVANTDGAEDAVTGLGAGGAGIHNYVTSVTIANVHASTNTFVQLLDGTGGTALWTFPAPATGGATHNFDPPLKQPTANTALYVDPGAAVTTVYISVAGFQAQG